MKIAPIITIIDRVNCHLGGDVPVRVRNEIRDKLSYRVKGCHMAPAYQTGNWDGKESLIDDDGIFYFYHINTVAEILAKYMDPDDIELKFDCDEFPDLPTDPIAEDFMLEETGWDLRSTQLRTINDAIAAGNGIFDAATSAGKTLICASLAKYYQDHLPSMTIVPSAQLLDQTFKYFEESGLDAVAISATKVKCNKKRLDLIRKHKHVVITYKLLGNLLAYADKNSDPIFSETDRVIMYDECHEFGDTMFDAFKYHLAMCTVRFGMSGTVPKDKLKREKIAASLGGDVITTVSVKELEDNGYTAKVNVKMITTKHKEIEELCTAAIVKKGHWDWDKEFSYFSNPDRLEAIAQYLFNMDPLTTLVLCHAQVGNKLGKIMEMPFIDKDTPVVERQRLFQQLADTPGSMQLASFDTSGTGISVNEILRVVIIDAGKNETHIKQGIGRGLRLDGVENECEVIDISADTYFAKKHRTERISIYKRDSYKYSKDSGVIRI